MPLESVAIIVKKIKIFIKFAGVAELADAPALGAGAFGVQVRLLSPAPNSINPNLLIVGDGFGFTFYIEYPNFNSKKSTPNVESH